MRDAASPLPMILTSSRQKAIGFVSNEMNHVTEWVP